MQLVIKGRNTEVSSGVREYVERKVGKLDHYLDLIGEAEVEVTEKKTKSHGERFVVQITTSVSGTILRAEERDDTVHAAVDAVTHTMIRQIERFKGKLYGRGRSGPTIRTGERITSATPEAGTEGVEIHKLVKVKRFSLKPMDVDEASEQMELLGHDFFLFLNSETEQFAVVYRRADGHYGLIEPEIS